MKNFITFVILIFCISSVFASDDYDQSKTYSRGESVHYYYDGNEHNIGYIAAQRSNGNYVIRFEEKFNEMDYNTNTHVNYIYSTKKCSIKTDDESRICGDSMAISLSSGLDVRVIAINNNRDLVIIMQNENYELVHASNLISLDDEVQ
jgi:hypothetical protein